MGFTYKTRDDSHVYYNANIYNNDSENFTTQAVFFEERTDPIIENADEFHLSVIRLNVPMLQQPILQIPDNYYSVSIFNPLNNILSTVNLIWVPDSTYLPLLQGPYNYIYSYANLVNIINTALLSAFNNVSVGPGYPLGITQPPIFQYNGITQKFGFYAQNAYDVRVNTLTTLRVYFNPALYNLFGFFPSFYNYGPNIALAPLNTITAYQIRLSAYDYNSFIVNPNSYFTTYQEISALYLVNTVKKIVLFANSIPIKTEEIAADNGTGVPNNLPILTDFNPILDANGNTRTDLVYLPTAEYKLSDLVSNNSLRKLGFSLFWQDEFNILHPIQIPPNKAISIKLLFRKIRNKYLGKD